MVIGWMRIKLKSVKKTFFGKSIISSRVFKSFVRLNLSVSEVQKYYDHVMSKTKCIDKIEL